MEGFLNGVDLGSVLIPAAILGVLWMAICAFRLANMANDKASFGIALTSHCGPQWDREIDALKTRVKSLEDAAARSKQRAADKQKVRIAKTGGAA